jgi:hypothetical protein
MKNIQPFANAEQYPHDRPFVSEIPKLRKLIKALNLVGLANNTKWNELLTHMREQRVKKEFWLPKFRFKCIDSDYVSNWEGDWFYRVPYPFICVSWFEIEYTEYFMDQFGQQKVKFDYLSQFDCLLKQIGFDYIIGKNAIRIFGYAPKDKTEFE